MPVEMGVEARREGVHPSVERVEARIEPTDQRVDPCTEIEECAELCGCEDGDHGPEAELNEAAANDIQPNVRKDGRELVFSSNRSGSQGQDIWVSTRESVFDAWTTPVNVGGNVNTAAGETRPSLSWDAQTLLFGRAPGPEGMSDIYIATRTRLTGSGG